MTLIHAAFSILAITAGLLPTSCDGYFRATPFSLESGLSVRTPAVLETNRPRPLESTIVGTIVLENGRTIHLYDTDGDGIPDQARDGHRRWEIKPAGDQGASVNGSFIELESSLPYRNPEFGNRTAEEWLVSTGLDHSSEGVGASHPVWVHCIRTTAWFVDLTIPSSSDCIRPSFHEHDIEYQWDVLESENGTDFELWRIAGDLTEVCRFVVACGIHELHAETAQGLLKIVYDATDHGMAVTMNGMQQEWIPLD